MSWRLREEPLDRTSSSLRLVADLECGLSDASVDDVQVVESPTEVRITVRVQGTKAGDDCPSPQEFDVTVELNEALGDRVLIDVTCPVECAIAP